MRLVADFDIVPAFLSKREAKDIFDHVAQAAGSSSGLDWDWFLALLGVVAARALSKQPVFHQLYPSLMSKVTVLLEMWGVGDPGKLQLVKGTRR